MLKPFTTPCTLTMVRKKENISYLRLGFDLSCPGSGEYLFHLDPPQDMTTVRMKSLPHSLMPTSETSMPWHQTGKANASSRAKR